MSAPGELLVLPDRKPGQPSKAQRVIRDRFTKQVCALIRDIRSRSDFQVSARGWGYLLEEHGVPKGAFKWLEDQITAYRKAGLLPLDIVADDDARACEHVQKLDGTPEAEALELLNYIVDWEDCYYPVSFWDSQPVYLEMRVEKIDLKSLFKGLCREYYVPLSNGRGWSDLNSLAAMMRRFQAAEAAGKRIVLLYCGDHDPVGLQISDFIKSNMHELADAVGWTPDKLEIDRFGLNSTFIDDNKLTWIDGLETGTGKRLDLPSYPDHYKPYVQNYMREFGARKVEANALVAAPKAGRALCHETLLKYLPNDAPVAYLMALEEPRAELQRAVRKLFGAEFGA